MKDRKIPKVDWKKELDLLQNNLITSRFYGIKYYKKLGKVYVLRKKPLSDQRAAFYVLKMYYSTIAINRCRWLGEHLDRYDYEL